MEEYKEGRGNILNLFGTNSLLQLHRELLLGSVLININTMLSSHLFLLLDGHVLLDRGDPALLARWAATATTVRRTATLPLGGCVLRLSGSRELVLLLGAVDTCGGEDLLLDDGSSTGSGRLLGAGTAAPTAVLFGRRDGCRSATAVGAGREELLLQVAPRDAGAVDGAVAREAGELFVVDLSFWWWDGDV
ncbi:hypothetical protein MN608_01093 [Microdochium nivale]|nr:hypothetical protein MN608_01093 [Microdochium nivale]